MNTDPVRTARWAGLAGIALVVVAVVWGGARLANAHEPNRHSAAPPPSGPGTPHPTPTTPRPTPSVPVPPMTPTPTLSTSLPPTPTPSRPTLTVPPLAGQPEDEAMSVLQLVGLRPTLRTARDDAHAPGTVLATIPAAGSSIDTGASVVVIVAAPSDDVPGGGSSPPTDPSATPTTPTPSGTPSAP